MKYQNIPEVSDLIDLLIISVCSPTFEDESEGDLLGCCCGRTGSSREQR